LIKTVIFDLGGTLIEYAGPYQTWPELETPGFQAAYNALSQNVNGTPLPDFEQLRDAGFALLPRMWQAAIRHEENLQVTNLLRQSLRQIGVEDISNAQLAEAAMAYGRAIQAQAELIEHARQTVAQIKAAGYQVGLVSNTMFPGQMHREDMGRFGLLPYFDALVFSADANKWKPNPDPFWQVLADLAASPDTAVYIGDDPASDIAGGQSAGMHTIYFQSSQRFSKPDSLEPHAEIASLPELLPLLEQWG
jgi:putative hydrolase of the HAD superfamily